VIINPRSAGMTACAVWVLLLFWLSSFCVLGDEKRIRQGEYLFRVSGCLSCHTDVLNNGPELAGGRALHTAFGIFYSPNITSDAKTGIGLWTDEEFLRALREGVSPKGEFYYPAFPYTSYTLMTDSDVLAMKAYIFSRPAVVKENVSHDLVFPISIRELLLFWRILFFSEGPFIPDLESAQEITRGSYLVDAVAHCGECHTPRNVLGAVVESQYLSGTTHGINGDSAPNITPHATGLMSWDQEDLIYFLRSGIKPNYDNVQGSMAEAIEHSLSFLNDSDLKAISNYLKTVTPMPTAYKKE